jgi:Uma2 family endonuclease
MPIETIQESTISDIIPHWEVELPPEDLIFDDGEPLETNRHRQAMNVLIRSMLTAFADRNDYFAGGNMFIYYSSKQVRNRDFRGPDFFVVLDVDGTKERQGWVVWEEDGRYPDVIVELISPSTAAIDLGIKRQIYAQTFRTSDYFVYNPFDPNFLRGWHLDSNQIYQELVTNDQGWLWCQRLGLWLGNWTGEIDGITATWLRFYDSQGNLVLLPEEAAEKALQQAQAQAQQAQAQAQQAQTEAQQAQAQAQQAQAQAQQAQTEAQQAKQAQLDAIPKLREMGLSLEQISVALGLSLEEINS